MFWLYLVSNRLLQSTTVNHSTQSLLLLFCFENLIRVNRFLLATIPIHFDNQQTHKKTLTSKTRDQLEYTHSRIQDGEWKKCEDCRCRSTKVATDKKYLTYQRLWQFFFYVILNLARCLSCIFYTMSKIYKYIVILFIW